MSRAVRRLALMQASRTYALQGGRADRSDQQQDKGQGLAESQLPVDTERNKHRQSVSVITVAVLHTSHTQQCPEVKM